MILLFTTAWRWRSSGFTPCSEESDRNTSYEKRCFGSHFSAPLDVERWLASASSFRIIRSLHTLLAFFAQYLLEHTRNSSLNACTDSRLRILIPICRRVTTSESEMFRNTTGPPRPDPDRSRVNQPSMKLPPLVGGLISDKADLPIWPSSHKRISSR